MRQATQTDWPQEEQIPPTSSAVSISASQTGQSFISPTPEGRSRPEIGLTTGGPSSRGFSVGGPEEIGLTTGGSSPIGFSTGGPWFAPPPRPPEGFGRATGGPFLLPRPGPFAGPLPGASGFTTGGTFPPPFPFPDGEIGFTTGGPPSGVESGFTTGGPFFRGGEIGFTTGGSSPRDDGRGFMTGGPPSSGGNGSRTGRRVPFGRGFGGCPLSPRPRSTFRSVGMKSISSNFTSSRDSPQCGQTSVPHSITPSQ